MSKILEIDNLSYRKNSKTILNHINLSLDSGKIIGLLGENGSGKTTLMRLIAGVNASSEKNIAVNGMTQKSKIKSQVSLSDYLDGFARSSRIDDIVRFYRNAYSDFSDEKY